jgi:hypothetical protein
MTGASTEDSALTTAAAETAARVHACPQSRRWPQSPAIGIREVLWVALSGVLLAILTSWPLVLHLSSHIAPDLGDPVRTAWQIAWVGHAMLHDPLHIFDSNAFYPDPLSLAFSDSLLGYGPTAFFGSGTVAALVRYNLLFLFAWSLCFVGAYMLARELGAKRIGGAVAGVAFAYAPYRVTEAGHLHVISSGGIALALFLLVRGYRRQGRWTVLAGWLVSAWQVSLGFTLGLQYSYLLAVLALLVLWHWWRGRLRFSDGSSQDQSSDRPAGRARGTRGPLIPRRLVIVSCVGMAALGAVAIYQARPYLKVANEYPTAKRTLKEVENYSSGPASLLSASSENRVWGSFTAPLREDVLSKNEDVFFPGLAIFLLALIGLALSRTYTRRLRSGLLAGIVVCSILAMGLGLTGAGYPYRLLYDYAPGWDGVRVPGRVFTLATLFYALLAGAGAQWLMGVLRGWASGFAPRTNRWLSGIVAGLLLIGLLGEGAGHLGHPLVPQPARAEIGLPGPIIDLPTDSANDRIWQYFSTDGFPKIDNGNSTFDIPSQDDLRGGMSGFPDEASVEKLRYYGIRTVVLHLKHTQLPGLKFPEVPEPQDPAAAAQKPIAGLGITRRDAGRVVIYEIGPGPKALHASGS